jgi:hypothetical protein
MRTRILPSQFGDLGGEWLAADNAMGRGSCRLTFEGTSVSGDCSNVDSPVDTSFEMTFTDLGTASGRTGRGAEFSAQKR